MQKMKFKSLSTITGFSIFAFMMVNNLTNPSIAKGIRDIQVEPQITKTSNKEYGNKQNNLSLVGGWKAVVNEKGKVTTIYVEFKLDGTYKTTFESGSRRGANDGNWRYSGNILTQTSSQTPPGRGSIKWVSKDEFILTIINNGDSYYEGVQRRYYRDNSALRINNQNNLYGSIAVFGYGSGHGISWNYSTEQEAIDKALEVCFERTRGKCKTAITFRNGCGALATSIGAWGAASHPDKLTAQKNALERCSGSYCRIKTVQCTD